MGRPGEKREEGAQVGTQVRNEEKKFWRTVQHLNLGRKLHSKKQGEGNYPFGRKGKEKGGGVKFLGGGNKRGSNFWPSGKMGIGPPCKIPNRGINGAENGWHRRRRKKREDSKNGRESHSAKDRELLVQAAYWRTLRRTWSEIYIGGLCQTEKKEEG